MTTEDYFNQDDLLATSKVPKEIRRFTYFDLLKFAEYYHRSELKLLNLDFASKRSELLIGFMEDLRKNGELPELLSIEKRAANYSANL